MSSVLLYDVWYLPSGSTVQLSQNNEGVYIAVPHLRVGMGRNADHANAKLLHSYFQNILKANRTAISSEKYPMLDDLYLDAGFQPEVESDFPYVERQSPRIPHIIHQIWLSSDEESSVPVAFIDNVKSYIKHNPDWTYFLWTNDTARQLLKDRFPNLLGFYDRLPKIVSKGDMLRYVVLFEYGGVYADFDTINYRPLDRVTVKYPCVLVPEPFEHAVMWYNVPYVVINAIMLCRPKHPFFKQIVDSLLSRALINNEVQSLGPAFLTVQYHVYNNLSDYMFRTDLSQNTTSPYFYKGNIPASRNDGIYIPNTRFFMDAPSPELKPNVESKCSSTELSPLERRMCVVVEKRGYNRDPGTYAFLSHLWSHTWSNARENDIYKFISVRNFTHNFRTYRHR